MIAKLAYRAVAWATVVFGLTGGAMAIPVTVDTVGVLNPNPNSLTIVDATTNGTAPNGVTMAVFKPQVQNAYTQNMGGILDFQQKFQGGSWPNAPSSNNGVDVGNGSTNPVTARYGASLASTMSFYRDPNGGNVANAIDSNTNQGTNVTSGGGATAGGGGTTSYDFTNQSFTGPTPTAGVGGGYMGVTNDANLLLQFTNGLTSFGITALPRGATRHSQLTFTFSDNTTYATSNEVVGTSAVFFGATVTPAQAALGVTITKILFSHPDGPNRYDDLGFIISVPESRFVGLAGMGLVGASIWMRRKKVS